MKYNIQLTVDEINAILNVLGGQPYTAVAGLIANIHGQYKQQEELNTAVVGDTKQLLNEGRKAK